MLIYDNWCKYDKIMCLLIKVLASLTSESRIFFFFLVFYFSKKMGRSVDGKRSIKLGWPYHINCGVMSPALRKAVTTHMKKYRIFHVLI